MLTYEKSRRTSSFLDITLFSLKQQIKSYPLLTRVFQQNLTALFLWNTQKLKFPIKDFLSKCDQIPRKLRIWSHLLKKPLMEIFIFCAVMVKTLSYITHRIPSLSTIISWLQLYFRNCCLMNGRKSCVAEILRRYYEEISTDAKSFFRKVSGWIFWALPKRLHHDFLGGIF